MPRSSAKDEPARNQSVRCAIYTRKSTEEGLEQDFNSLDAQREACEAFVASQRHEGWKLLPELYDDGGYSGGKMERPGLRQLLDDVKAGKVDVIVVYKVDRLTRSLADFAKIVEILDERDTSFVSVTQSFNTTTSMGRLTLNVLLSFAQFEREVTGERIRDKVAASKKKGMWMGGVVPLGYNVRDRKLIINDEEAETVRLIFDRYAELGSTGDLVEELDRRGIRTKQRALKDGRVYGGKRFQRGALAHLLQNCIYAGKISHQGKAYPGEHSPIIERALWKKVQIMLASNRRERRVGTRAKDPSLLASMITDPRGRPMSPSHATKGNRRYRYYVSRTEVSQSDAAPWRLPAGPIERLVVDRVSLMLGSDTLVQMLKRATSDMSLLMQSRAAELSKGLSEGSRSRARGILLDLGLAVQIEEDQVVLCIDCRSFLSQLLADQAGKALNNMFHEDRIELSVPVQFKRRGSELKLVFRPEDTGAPAQRDPKLIGLVTKAFAARDALMDASAETETYDRAHLTRLARLSYLAPDMIVAIAEGRQPPDLTARRLLRASDVPHEWPEQRKMFGFA